MKDHPDATLYNGDQPIHLEVTLLKVKTAFKDGNSIREIGTDSLFDDEGKLRKGFVEAEPITTGSIRNLEVEESSLALGARGSITITNEYNALEILQLNNTIEYELYIMITAFDPKLEELGVEKEKNGFSILAFCTNLLNASRNFIDNVVQFRWEEAFVNSMRSTSMRTVVNNWNSQNVLTPGNNSSVSGPKAPASIACNVKTVAEHIYQSSYQQDFSIEAKSKRYFQMYKGGSIVHSKSYTPNIWHSINEDPTSRGGEVTAYDMLNAMLNESLVGNPENSIPSQATRCGYFRMANDTATNKTDRTTRRMLFAPFVSDLHREFLMEVADETESSKEKIDKYTDVYTEKFAFGPLASMSMRDRNTSMFNILETYNMKMGDVNALKENIWGNYGLYTPSLDPGLQTAKIHTYTFSQLQSNYVNNEFGGAIRSFNLPTLNDGNLRQFEVLSPGGIHAWDDSSNSFGRNNAAKKQYNYAYSRVAKSFLTVAETISFNAKGSMIRQPNRFIWIEKTTDLLKTPGSMGGEDKNGLLDKLYYVNRVKHIWNGEAYTNEIEASKWTGDNDIVRSRAVGDEVDALRVSDKREAAKEKQTQIEAMPRSQEEYRSKEDELKELQDRYKTDPDFQPRDLKRMKRLEWELNLPHTNRVEPLA